MAFLTFTDPSGTPQRFEIKKKLTTIGRTKSNDLAVEDPEMMPQHAHILADGSGHMVSSLDPKATIVVNGRARRNYALQDGDILTLGATEFTYDAREGAVKVMESTDDMVRRKPRLPDDERLSRLFRFSEKLLAGQPLDGLFKTLLDSVIESTGADKGFLLLIRNERVEIPAARNVDKVDLGDDPDQISDTVVARVIKERKALIISDALKDTILGQSQSVVDLKLNSVMCVPLIARGLLIGILYVGNNRIVDLFTEDDLEQLKIYSGWASIILQNALLMDQLRSDNERLRQALAEGTGKIIGSCAAMKGVFRTIQRVAPTDISVLILGETGTGKELVAREIHALSDRKDKPFISINCGAIPENLLESELFGHVKGAFTGAVASKIGKFEAADGGTLLLDEIGEMPLTLQVKLLRVIQERAIEKVGDVKQLAVDIRIVSATNKDLDAEVKAGRFREDLYYRLNEIAVELPPLRERGDDIVEIGQHLLKRYAVDYGGKANGFSSDAARAVRNYFWPGNVREMENRIKKAVVMGDRPLVGPDDLGFSAEETRPRFKALAQAREDFQVEYIREALMAHNWNKAQTAKTLDVDPRTIFRYVEKFKQEA